MQAGYYMNHFPKMVPARNWDSQRPSQPTIPLPCPKNATSGKPEFVWAGMILSATADGKSWEIPSRNAVRTNTVAGEKPADSSTPATTPSVIAVAQDNTVGTQSHNVVMADSLVGLPCTGNFRIVTPFYKRGVAYTVGTPLTFATAADLSAAPTAFTTPDGVLMHGAVRPAEDGEVVIGYVVRTHDESFYVKHIPSATPGQPDTIVGVVNYDDETANPTNTTDQALALRKTIDSAEDSTAFPCNEYVIEFDTAHQPTRPA